MAWTLTDDLDAFLAAAGGFLRARPAAHTLPLTITESLRASGPGLYGGAPPRYGWWTEDGEVGGAFVQTPPHPIVLTELPGRALPALAEALDGGAYAVPGVNAPADTAEAFAGAWRERRGGGLRARVAMRERLYRLTTLAWPDPMPPGAARVAGEADRPLLTDWYRAFGEETGAAAVPPGQAVTARLGYGGLTLWEADGTPVAMAGVSRAVAGMVRVGPVYTPPALRGRGYGGAVTAAVSGAARERGLAEVLLFTDLANPTSNGLYQRLGYEPAGDYAVWAFSSGA